MRVLPQRRGGEEGDSGDGNWKQAHRCLLLPFQPLRLREFLPLCRTPPRESLLTGQFQPAEVVVGVEPAVEDGVRGEEGAEDGGWGVLELEAKDGCVRDGAWWSSSTSTALRSEYERACAVASRCGLPSFEGLLSVSGVGLQRPWMPTPKGRLDEVSSQLVPDAVGPWGDARGKLAFGCDWQLVTGNSELPCDRTTSSD